MRPGRIFASAAVLLLSGSIALAAKPAKQDKGKPGAPALLSHSITVKPGEYVSLHTGKAYGAADAVAHKEELDFVYLVANDGGTVKKEFYNLSGKDTKLPAEVLGTKAGIVQLTWDDELVAKCKTVADLKRMTGSYTANSFSFYGTAANNAQGDIEKKRFIFLDSKERMGFFTIKPSEGDALALEVRITP